MGQSRMLAGVAVALCVCMGMGGVSGATWAVTLENGPNTPCTMPSNCTFGGALTAAVLGDQVVLQTDVVTQEGITVRSGLSDGTLKVMGGGHVVRTVAGNQVAIDFLGFGPGKVVEISDLSFSSFSGTSDRSVICMTTGTICLDDFSDEREVVGRSPHTPFRPTLILNGVTFYNNSSPQGMLSMFDLYGQAAELGLLVNQCTFLDNSALDVDRKQSHSGLLMLLSTQTLVTESLFQGNTFSTALAGVPSWSSFETNYSQVKAWDNTFVGPFTQGPDGHGYVIRAGDSSVRIDYSTFQRNHRAVLGFLARELTMEGTLLATPKPIGHYTQLQALSTLSMGECDVYISDGEGPAIIEAPTTYNRNPGSLSLNCTYPPLGCGKAGMGQMRCQQGASCTGLIAPGSGHTVGYKCLPAM